MTSKDHLIMCYGQMTLKRKRRRQMRCIGATNAVMREQPPEFGC